MCIFGLSVRKQAAVVVWTPLGPVSILACWLRATLIASTGLVTQLYITWDQVWRAISSLCCRPGSLWSFELPCKFRNCVLCVWEEWPCDFDCDFIDFLAFGRSVIFSVLIVLIHEHRRSFHLQVTFWISFSTTLRLPPPWPLLYLVRLFPRYFISSLWLLWVEFFSWCLLQHVCCWCAGR
jgi:hypothetical protein